MAMLKTGSGTVVVSEVKVVLCPICGLECVEGRPHECVIPVSGEEASE